MEAPTPSQPYVVNDDGTVSVLIYRGRTNRIAITHRGLADPTGYAARCAFKRKYADAEPVLAASTTPAVGEGQITLTAVADGTLITIVFTDEMTEDIVGSSGVWDVLLESPGGEEDPVVPSSPWMIWKEVAS